ncbi:MAG: hypothetical protein PVF28_08325, partial [Thioalkalispiraceae bacterium]
NGVWYAQWSVHHADLMSLILNRYVGIPPQPHAQREVSCIMATDNQYGRFISIEEQRYKWIYLIKMDRGLISKTRLEKLAVQIEAYHGHIYYHDKLVIVDLPLGSYLEISFAGPFAFELKQIEYVDLEAL